MNLRTIAALALGGFSSLVFGCGGGSTPPLTPDVAPAGEGGAPEAFGEVNPADLAELDGGGASKTPAPSSGAITADSTPSGGGGAAGGAPSPPDECTPVGVDFEKRARPKMKECYAVAKKKDPNLQGTVKITLDVDTLGKAKAPKIIEKTLPESVAQCMLKVVKSTPLPDVAKCAGKSLTIPMTFPTPH